NAIDPRHAEGARRAFGEVDHTSLCVRAAIRDLDRDGAAVAQVHDTHLRAEGQGAVTGRERVWIEDLAARGALLELVPGGEPAADLARWLRRDRSGGRPRRDRTGAGSRRGFRRSLGARLGGAFAAARL